MPDNLHPEDRTDQARRERDLAMDVAAAEAAERRAAEAERDMAATAAAIESLGRHVAEARAIDARIQADQAQAGAREVAVDRNVLRHELAHERAAASGNAFGFYLALTLLVLALVLGGFYFYYWQNRDNVDVMAGPPPAPSNTTVVVPGPQPSAPPVIVNPPAQPPPVVNVYPPAPGVETDVNVTPPATEPCREPAPEGGAGASGSDASGGSSQ